MPKQTADDDAAGTDWRGLVRAQHGIALPIVVFRRFWKEDVSVVAAGVALFALLALPGLLVALVSLYGMVSTPGEVLSQIDWLSRNLPPEVSAFFREQMQYAIESAPSGKFAGGLLFSLLATQEALATLMKVVNGFLASSKNRSFVRLHALSMGLTLVSVVVFLGYVLLIVAVPQLPAALHLHRGGWRLWELLRWPAAFGVLVLAFSGLYRFAPASRRVRWPSAALGGVVAAALCNVFSFVLSMYVVHLVDYSKLYGAAGALIVVILWFYLGAGAVLFGALVTVEHSLRLRHT
ncbi:MAG: YihY/virulence factor BrkB family protein [Myxococcaceae bacterium]